MLLASLACNLQRPNLQPLPPDFPALTQPNQDPNIPPPSKNIPPAPPAVAPGVTQVTSSGGGTVALQILSPLEGTVVNTAQIEVQGIAAPGAVVTVNDEILIADADGRFSVVIHLEAGLNLIEIIASDALGNQAVVELTVIYET